MRRLSLTLLLVGSLARIASAQSGAVIPQGGAGHAASASCVILKRMGPADEVTSHLYSFGFRGKQFQYVEGKLPDGFPFHGRMTDHDVRNLQGRGAEVIVVKQDYTADELKQARQDCMMQTGKSPDQSVALTQPPSATAAPAAAPTQAQLKLASTPDGADIEIDGNFVGTTPSTVGVQAGQHKITIKKSGFNSWERQMTVSNGDINVNATLEAEVK